MNAQTMRHSVEEAVADAAREVPGVAYLRPGLSGLLGGTTARIARATGRPEPVSGVRAVPTADRSGWRVDIKLTTLPGHRVVDVTRAVRDAAGAAARDTLSGEDERVTVTVRVTVTGTL
ncbi:Asp23/Gls24 family envelope stress response protein [Streptomyces sp. NPDC091292]|uniref:Asp23/Gls24 family envelope stress response protein n=1 Tax=Streptomyces sp. NPDC091292 TaxID=3365991 RepID=UPI0038015008